MKKATQLIAKLDRNRNITGSVERWHAHEKGILHRAFSAALIYKGSYILQHRKHVAFDGMFDLTSSSHQDYMENGLEDTVEAAIKCVLREWKISKKDLGKPKLKGSVYYKAKDANSKYTEHEYCDVIEIEINKLPEPNFEVAYGYSLVTKKELTNKKGKVYPLLAPWVKVAISKKLI